MSTSRSNSSNATSTQDLRTTNTLNSLLEGDVSDAAVISGNYGNTDLGIALDESMHEYAYSDDSDNSFNPDLEDNSDNSVNHITDGGAFDIVDNLVGKLIDTLGENQSKTLDAANNLASRSLDGAMSIKAGQTITEPANQTMREMAKAGMVVAGVAGAAYTAAKVFGKGK